MTPTDARSRVLRARYRAGHPLPATDLARAADVMTADATDAAWRLVTSRDVSTVQILRPGARRLEYAFAAPGCDELPKGSRDRVVNTADGAKYEGALHEAAHSVCAKLCGGYTVKLRLHEQGGGGLTVAIPENVRGCKPWRQIVLFHLAGSAAELEIESDNRAAADEDERAARAAAKAGGITPAEFAELREQARRLVFGHWHKVLSVAADLLAAGGSATGLPALKLVEQACKNAVTIK